MTKNELRFHCESQIAKGETWAEWKKERPHGKFYEACKSILELLDENKLLVETLAENKTIPLDKVKQVREEIWKNVYEYSGTGDEVLQAYRDGFKASLQIIDKLMKEVEE